MTRFAMKGFVLAVGLILAGVAVAAEGDWGKAGYDQGFKFESADGRFDLAIDNRVQFRFTWTDPDGGDSTGSFRVRRYKFKVDGTAFGHWDYKFQMNFAGTGDSGRDVLEDANVTYTRNRLAQVWIGQGKAFFGRQELTSSGKQQFVDRSIASAEFAPGRDIGVGLIGQNESKTFEYNVGVYNGNGLNQTSNDNDAFLYVGRVVFTPFGAYKLEESSLDYPEDPRFAIGASAMQNTITDTGVDLDATTLGIEAAFKLLGFNTVAEYYSRTDDLAGGGDVDTTGGYAQVAYLLPGKKLEFAGRYAFVDVDGGEKTTETGLGVSYYFSKHRYKAQGDYRVIDRDLADTQDGEVRVQLQIQF